MSLYLDGAATTKPKQEVIDAMMPYFTDMWSNPSSIHSDALKVDADINAAKSVVAKFINAESNEIYFTSCGSESNCWAIKGFVDERMSKGHVPCIITTEIEHHSILACVDDMSYAIVYKLGVDERGFIDIQELNNVINNLIDEYGADANDILVSIQLANNEIGTIQNMAKIVNAVKKHGDIMVHTDAVQAFGHIPINVFRLGVDMLSASGHKIGAPKGIGILYKKNGVCIKPLIYGTQMNGMRGGTENVPYIIGFAKAVELAEKDIDLRKNISRMRNYLVEKLENAGCKLNGAGCSTGKRLPNNVNVVLPNNISAESMLYALELGGIIISSGSACNSKEVEASHVLTAIGLEEQAYSSVRITVPNDITYAEIDSFVREFERACIVASNNN